MLRTDTRLKYAYEIRNGSVRYCRQGGNLTEETEVFRDRYSVENEELVSSEQLYVNRCGIGYTLPKEMINEVNE